MQLNRVRKSSSVSQNHLGLLPNERDGISMSEMSLPAIWRGVSGIPDGLSNAGPGHG